MPVEYTRCMYDLLYLALQTDSTRVVTLSLGGMNAVPSNIPGVKTDWHNLSHHGQDDLKIEQLKKVETLIVKAFGDLLSDRAFVLAEDVADDLGAVGAGRRRAELAGEIVEDRAVVVVAEHVERRRLHRRLRRIPEQRFDLVDGDQHVVREGHRGRSGRDGPAPRGHLLDQERSRHGEDHPVESK